jgi:hypothetical protein
VLVGSHSRPLLDGTVLDYVEIEPGRFDFIFVPPAPPVVPAAPLRPAAAARAAVQPERLNPRLEEQAMNPSSTCPP